MRTDEENVIEPVAADAPLPKIAPERIIDLLVKGKRKHLQLIVLPEFAADSDVSGLVEVGINPVRVSPRDSGMVFLVVLGVPVVGMTRDEAESVFRRILSDD